jgi:putative endonuclease
MSPSQTYYIYILKCRDHSLYVGHTANLKNRLYWYRCGFASLYAAARLPVRLVYSEKYVNQQPAIARELQRKNWSRLEKEALINGDTERLRNLTKSRD